MIELGRGAKAVLSAGGRGVVAATFEKAAYLRLSAGLIALVGPGVPSGPLHVRGAIPIRRLAAGDQVTVDGSSLQVGVASLDLAGATTWCGELPGSDGLAAAAALALELLERAPPSALAGPPYAARVTLAVAELGRHQLGAAGEALVGLGPGLTPAGDDTLAGVLVVARAWRGAGGEAALVDIAAEARTNDIARAFLAWAARGQSIEPVHRFLTAAARHDDGGAGAALRSLLAVGHSSGADLAFGLRLGFRAFVAPAA